MIGRMTAAQGISRSVAVIRAGSPVALDVEGQDSTPAVCSVPELVPARWAPKLTTEETSSADIQTSRTKT